MTLSFKWWYFIAPVSALTFTGAGTAFAVFGMWFAATASWIFVPIFSAQTWQVFVRDQRVFQSTRESGYPGETNER